MRDPVFEEIKKVKKESEYFKEGKDIWNSLEPEERQKVLIYLLHDIYKK